MFSPKWLSLLKAPPYGHVALQDRKTSKHIRNHADRSPHYFSDADKEMYSKLFETLQLDEDGYLVREEFIRFLRQLGFPDSKFSSIR